LAKVSFVLSQFTRLTDRQKDGNVVANTVLHSMPWSAVKTSRTIASVANIRGQREE